MNKLMLFFSAFRKGNELADSAKWKAHQITATMVGGFIVVLIQLIKGFGYDIPIDSEGATAIGAGIIAVVNVLLTMLTSKRAGVSEQTGASVPETHEAVKGPPKVLPVQDKPEALNRVANTADDSARWAENNN